MGTRTFKTFFWDIPDFRGIQRLREKIGPEISIETSDESDRSEYEFFIANYQNKMRCFARFGTILQFHLK